jgi:hypothetical protein
LGVAVAVGVGVGDEITVGVAVALGVGVAVAASVTVTMAVNWAVADLVTTLETTPFGEGDGSLGDVVVAPVWTLVVLAMTDALPTTIVRTCDPTTCWGGAASAGTTLSGLEGRVSFPRCSGPAGESARRSTSTAGMPMRLPACSSGAARQTRCTARRRQITLRRTMRTA